MLDFVFLESQNHVTAQFERDIKRSPGPTFLAESQIASPDLCRPAVQVLIKNTDTSLPLAEKTETAF